MNRWLVFNIGCIECGVSSDIVGFYETQEEAEQVALRMKEKLGWREGGQNEFEVFDCQQPMAAEYLEALL